MKKKFENKKQGFTLIEILVVIGIIAILAAVVLVAINPGRQFAQARNSQRISNVNSILNAIGQNSADNRGVFTCDAGPIPSSPTQITTDEGGYNLRNCISPSYITEIPVDPLEGQFTSAQDYSTGYSITQDPTTNRITIFATYAELDQEIQIRR
ncbi:MAG: type II secretion system GspH family protein [bacterium]|nr:type II secretion system GspH family protein [bacterium]